jgi:hypothetical protein
VQRSDLICRDGVSDYFNVSVTEYYSVVLLFRIIAKIVPLPSNSSQANIIALKVCAEEDSVV